MASARSLMAAYTDGDVAMYRPYSGRAQPPPASVARPDSRSSAGSRSDRAARLARCTTLVSAASRRPPRTERSILPSFTMFVLLLYCQNQVGLTHLNLSLRAQRGNLVARAGAQLRNFYQD